METKQIFAERLKELLKENEITIYKLAKDLKYNKQTIYNWIYCNNEPNITALKKVADYFNVCSDFLIGRQNYY